MVACAGVNAGKERHMSPIEWVAVLAVGYLFTLYLCRTVRELRS